MDIEGAVSIDRAAADAEAIRALLGASVSAVDREGPGDLAISLGGRDLVLHDSNAQYESYVIGGPGVLIVV